MYLRYDNEHERKIHLHDTHDDVDIDDAYINLPNQEFTHLHQTALRNNNTTIIVYVLCLPFQEHRSSDI